MEHPYLNIEACFNVDELFFVVPDDLPNKKLTQLILRYRDFESVLSHITDNMGYRTDVIADVLDTTEAEVLRALLEKRVMSVLYCLEGLWDDERIMLGDIYDAYLQCFNTIT